MYALSPNAQKLERILPESLDYVSDAKLREFSGLDDDEYTKAKKELVDAGLAEVGRGRGGPIRRTGTRAQQVYSLLPKDGSFVSNNRIYEPLGLTPEEFEEIQGILLAEGKIVVGRGRYGRTARAVNGNASQIIPQEQYDFSIDNGDIDASELYEAVRNYFDRKWKRNYEPSPPNLYRSEITATQTRLSGGMKIPDISILTIMHYDFLPCCNLELVSVDVKRYRELDVIAVYETASFGLFSHRAYLVFEWIEESDFTTTNPGSEIVSEAKRLGIGLVQMRLVNGGKWEFKTILTPQLQKPEMGEQNSYIEFRFKKDHARILEAISYVRT